MTKEQRKEFDKIMCVLSRARILFPSLRVGQLIINATSHETLSTEEHATALFYMPDEVLFNCLKEFCENVTR